MSMYEMSAGAASTQAANPLRDAYSTPPPSAANG